MGCGENKKSIKEKMDAWIPRYLPASVLLKFMSLTSYIYKVSDEMSGKHRLFNDARWKEHGFLATDKSGCYIEHQKQLSFLRYGRHSDRLSKGLLGGVPLTGRENTCEVIAVYNCLCWLSKRTEKRQKSQKFDIRKTEVTGILASTEGFPELLEHFEKSGIALGGYFGTSPLAVKNYLINKGFVVEMLTGRQITGERLANWQNRENAAYILTTYNDKNHLTRMIHTVCITKEEDGFVIHNDYEGTKSYPSLADAVYGYHLGQGKPIVVMLVKEVTNG